MLACDLVKHTEVAAHLRRHVLGRATSGLAARPKILRFAISEVAQLDDGQTAPPMVDQHVVQLQAADSKPGSGLQLCHIRGPSTAKMFL